MPEKDLNSSATKFISSFVKSLHNLCTDEVEFRENIELIGYIGIRIDHKYRFDYIVDEQVSRESENSDTIFLSNSYHSCPSTRQSKQKSSTYVLDKDIRLSEMSRSNNIGTEQLKTDQDNVSHSHNFHMKEILVNTKETTASYSVSSENWQRQGRQAKETFSRLEGNNNTSDFIFQSSCLGSTEVKNTKPSSYTELPGRTKKHEGSRKLVKKTPPLFSCREYLEQYSSFYAKKNQHSSKQEMMKVFSDLAQKYGVAITVKSARLTAQPVFTTKTSNIISTTTVAPVPLCSADTLNTNSEVETEADKKSLQHRTVKTDKTSDETLGHLSDIPVEQSMQSSSKTLTVISTDTGNVLCGDLMSSSSSYQTLIQDSEYGIKCTDNIIILSDSLIPYIAPEISSTVDTQTLSSVSSQETFNSKISCNAQKSGPAILGWYESSPTKVSGRSTTAHSKISCFVEPDVPSINVALTKEESLSSSSTSHSAAQEHLRQQPMPKHHRGNYLVRLRKENPICYKQYKSLSKEDQARERRRIREVNKDPDATERKSLMNRVLYFRRVNKLPPGMRDKSNHEIRLMSTDDLKKLLPPTKSLKNMDPVAREEWYRLGRSREWRRRKKLLDPEGFKRYNNERAKRYQDNLRKNNPEKYKELRAKGADRLRQYRLGQKIMKAIKEGREIEISELPAVKLKETGDNKEDEVVEVREAEEQLSVDESVDKTNYIISECANAPGDAATSRESSYSQTDQSLQPDILDFMYNY